MVRNKQIVVEQNYKELFQKFDGLTGGLSTMQRTILALQNKALVADAKEVDQFIETWFFIYSLGREVLEHRLACDI